MSEEYSGIGVWCVAELRHGNLVPTLFELFTAGRKLADSLGQPLCAVILGGPGKASQAAKASAQRGADKIYVLEHESLDSFVDEAHALALERLIEKEKPAKILFSASVYGRSLSARAAALCRGSLANDVVDVGLDADKHLLATRPCYAGNLLAVVKAQRGPEMATVRPMSYPRAEISGKNAETVSVPVDASSWNIRAQFKGFSPDESKEIDLSSAEKIVSGGRGLGNPKGFEMIRDLARTLGAAVGASRPTVDAGWMPYRHQVGLTGRTVRPALYVACGISGQVQHLAGMSSSDFIVAVNTDPECPMMKLANLAVQGDVYKVVPAIIAEIKKQRGDAAA